MQKTEETTIATVKVVGLVCDVCGREIEESDYIGMQEAICLDEWGGFGSLIGDGAHWQIDICQECFSKVFGDYIRIIN